MTPTAYLRAHCLCSVMPSVDQRPLINTFLLLLFYGDVDDGNILLVCLILTIIIIIYEGGVVFSMEVDIVFLFACF